MTFRKQALLTVDLEDYRYQQLRDHCSQSQKYHPEEVTKQVSQLLDLFESLGARATFFSVGQTVAQLSKPLLNRIVKWHRIGCHGFEHRHVARRGETFFREDIKHGKSVLEEAFGTSVLSYRAPYFSCDGCSSWFGLALAEADFRYDSSQRLSTFPSGFRHCFPIVESNGLVMEVPLPSIGLGEKRPTIIGGTYFRLLPLNVIQKLMARAEQRRFLPAVYLHPYDIDPEAPQLDYPSWRYWPERIGDKMRRAGRTTVREKLQDLARIYSFIPVEEVNAKRCDES